MPKRIIKKSLSYTIKGVAALNNCEKKRDFWKEMLKTQEIKELISRKIFEASEVRMTVGRIKVMNARENEVFLLLISPGKRHLFYVKIEKTSANSFDVPMIYESEIPDGRTAIECFEEAEEM